ncbi:hypothetical protein P153DRAFT_341349 [Dothidotthia symphoricarpi CBS 119687]|uniref:Capsule polysaccharide biosynthesis protein n=1 Tax=Dothidotthia symphoricarpi CBS 119687 TaxID=1392245 RepID=A0A6A6ABL4_9PLEO|nr:uncharacterized protein P153DRAFT_341349 [Dothidotthia symphoricarpi CBS 119687]KAF2128966.1 hypothetical protein P153DRAFT_341349 [Dothidotthia symphoricarpi CBS 119687]
MRTMALLVVAGAAIAAFASQPTLRNSIIMHTVKMLQWTGYDKPGGVWRILAILLALVNLKNLPGVWHLRFFRALFYQIYLQPTPIPPHALFHPVITSSRTTLLETDYNLHKSNSTYFSDMDISRTHLFTALIRNGIKKNSRLYGAKKTALNGAIGATEGTRGGHLIALGGVSCLFKREIKPYVKYEMWTRLLCWDQKWFYLVTHLVKPGHNHAKQWSLQPWRKDERTKGEKEHDDKELLNAVYATAIAKYVTKRGRITVPPEVVLADAGMVPQKPEGWVYQAKRKPTSKAADNNVTPNLRPEPVDGTEWNWDIIEAERRRGLVVAQKFAEMDGMHGFFDGGKDGVMGEYVDLLF